MKDNSVSAVRACDLKATDTRTRATCSRVLNPDPPTTDVVDKVIQGKGSSGVDREVLRGEGKILSRVPKCRED